MNHFKGTPFSSIQFSSFDKIEKTKVPGRWSVRVCCSSELILFQLYPLFPAGISLSATWGRAT